MVLHTWHNQRYPSGYRKQEKVVFSFFICFALVIKITADIKSSAQ
jgi:hypothetical protein